MNARELLDAATPRPWKLDDGSVSRALIYGGVKEGVTRTLICEIDTSWESDAAAAEADADAALIVRCVNEHEALLALEGAARSIAAKHAESGECQCDEACGPLAKLDEVRGG